MPEDSIFIGQQEPLVAKRPSEPEVALTGHAIRTPGSNVYTKLKALCRDLGLRAVPKSDKAYVKALRLSCIALENYENGNMVQVGLGIEDYSTRWYRSEPA